MPLESRSVPLVSVIVPVYNAGAYLEDCLASIRAQTFMDFECILIDDGSTDGSGALCEKYAALDGRFSVIRQSNKGACAARFTGIENSRASVAYTFCDADDTLEPKAIELLFNEMQRSGAKCVFGAESITPPPKRLEQDRPQKYLARRFASELC
ncbi:MAG: glycosyltransferase [Spirochaetaceae bacterium]|jgi:CDP-glycerol glycerophosphotransferase|nr:glycosyltransferase [Spirochaetaceae bacterium]